MTPRIEKFVVKVVTPRSGEPVTNRELAEYIRFACKGHWSWADRMKWTVKR